MGNEDSMQRKGLYIFGTDVLKIPCFRNSFFYGICTGIVTGLVCFMGTSKPAFSTHIGFASMWVGVIAIWFPCRYLYESKEMVRIAFRSKVGKEMNESGKNTSENDVL